MNAEQPPAENLRSEEKTADQVPLPPTGQTDAPAPQPAWRYKPVQFHAQGNLGEVHIAQDDELNRSVALKRIQERYANDAESRRRFLREAEVTGRLEHPGVVPVYGLGQGDDGRPCYAMRFIQGESLKEAIERFHAAEKPGRDPGERRLALRQLLTSFVTVCKTMAYAHSRGIIHRDLKPANIMLGKYGETLVVDWGLARAFERDETARSQGEASLTPSLAGAAGETQVGKMVGTPAYASPEQAAGLWDVVGPTSDIFSLGATLYNLLTNQIPYDGSGVLEIIAQASAGEVIPPRQRKKDVPRALEAICLKAMAHKRTERYGTALELAADVEDWLADEPVRAHRESVVERLGRLGRRHRAAAVAGGALGLAVVAVALALVLANARNAADNARQHEQAARQIAEEKSELADQAQKAEEAQRQLAEERATYLRVANGVPLLDQGDYFGALLWFAKALAEERRGPEYEEMHRSRLGMVLAQCPRLTQVWRHGDRVYFAAFSPDGRRVVTASGEAAQVWDTATGVAVTAPLKLNGYILDATFRLGACRVIGAQLEGTRVWDMATGQPVTPPLKHDGQVLASFSPDGRRFVTASLNDPARVWSAATGQPITPPLKHKDAVRHACFSPDSRRIATASLDHTARVWDAATGQPITPPLKHDASVDHASFSPDGRRIVTTSSDRTARVWDAVSGQPVTPPLEHNKPVNHAAFSPDGRRVVTASRDGTARVWGAASGRPLTPPLKHDDPVYEASFSPDGRRIVTASQDGTARVWEAANGQPVTPPLKHNAEVVHASFSPDGRRVVTASEDGSARVWDTAGGQPVIHPLEHSGDILRASFISPDGRRVLTATEKGARIWDTASRLPVTHHLKYRGNRLDASFNLDGRRVVIACSEQTVQVWDTTNGQPVSPPLKTKGPVVFVSLSADGHKVVAGSADGTARVWDISTGQSVTPPLNHGSLVAHASFSPDGRRVVTASWDKTARVWDATTGQPVSPPLKHHSFVVHATFSPDGRHVVTASDDRTARVWDAATGQPATPPLKHNDGVRQVSFSPDGKRVLTSTNLTARAWDMTEGQPLTPPMKHREPLLKASFSPDGRRIVTASQDGTARVWEAASGQPVTPPLKHGDVRDVSFGPDGRQMLTVSWRQVRFWPVVRDDRPAADLLELAQLLAGYRLDQQGGQSPLDMETWHTAWTRLRERYPADFQSSLEGIRAWHQEEADACAAADLWAGALVHLDRLIEADPGNPNLRSSRGNAHAELGHWSEAAADFRKSPEVEADLDVANWHLLCLAGTGAWDQYRQACTALLERHAGEADPQAANAVAWYCVRFGKAKVDPTRALKLAEQAVAAAPDAGGALNTLAAALYCAGRYADAIQKLDRVFRLPNNEAYDWLLLALAHQKLHHAEEAKKWLTKAQTRIDQAKQERADRSNLTWEQRLELQLLRAEAVAVVGNAP
jgi:WD40 repeat protein/tRNA A-37 threonylcarbamoyl transferase component Bud32